MAITYLKQEAHVWNAQPEPLNAPYLQFRPAKMAIIYQMAFVYLVPKIVQFAHQAVHACSVSMAIICPHWIIKPASIAQYPTAKSVTLHRTVLNAWRVFQAHYAWMPIIVDINVQSATYQLALPAKLIIF